MSSASEYPSTDYKPSLSLEGISQPSIAVGASRYGAAIGGGIAFQFGDMLGDHMLTTVVQVNSGTGLSNDFSFKNTAAEAVYFNAAHRVNWGLIGGQIPYLSGGFAISSAVRKISSEVSGFTAIGGIGSCGAAWPACGGAGAGA